MRALLIEAGLAGLSTGMFCCLTCYPFLAPVFAAEARSARRNLDVWLQFLLGRLAGYVLFGAAIGWLGERFASAWLDRVSILGLLLMALVLVFYAIGFRRPRWSFCAAGTPRAATAPLLLGFLLGLHICPPFLMSVAYVFTLHSALKGIVYFLVFFAATTLYFLPLFFLGFLSKLNEFRAVARVSAVLVGLLFIAYGIYAMSRGILVVHSP